MKNNGDDNIYENPFDESFYMIPEETDTAHSVILLNLSGISSRSEFYERVREAIEVPDYFGDNLDALYDILTEISSETIIKVTGMDSTAPEMESYMKKFRELCEDICGENEFVKIIYVDNVL